ncbi:MAG: TldD/PmbA family protein [Myxococcota bacterium]
MNPEQQLIDWLRPLGDRVDFCSLRLVERQSQKVTVRKGVMQPLASVADSGVMVTVVHQGGMGYGATCALSEDGLRDAFEQAKQWACLSGRGKWGCFDASKLRLPTPNLTYTSQVRRPWEDMALHDKIDLLKQACDKLREDDRIVEWEAGLWHTKLDETLWTSHDSRARQSFHYTTPHLHAVAHQEGVTQERSLGGYRGHCSQGGLEVLDHCDFLASAQRIGQEVLELVAAPNCPSGCMDVVLDPGQMMLQIHESIGHPLELDRILGDERNYAGGSFVTPEMFGEYRYGSELLNVAYDPTISHEIATFACDAEGSPARKEFVIRDGILRQPLGGVVSAFRGGRENPVATARAQSWNRPPIDRMSNLNLEPGETSFADLVASVERGIYMRANKSWSIDQMRNKFQFGCEWGRLIENGTLTHVVRNPCYRGVSASFWRSLKAVGDKSTFQVLGSPYCGKGEPNQCVHVGHATPAALFADVDVFGGV